METNIDVEVEKCDTDKLEDLLSSTKMFHNECYGGEIEKSLSAENILMLVCKKCGTINGFNVAPGGANMDSQKLRTALINFLTNPPIYGTLSLNCVCVLSRPEIRDRYCAQQEKERDWHEFLEKAFEAALILSICVGIVLLCWIVMQAVLGVIGIIIGIRI